MTGLPLYLPPSFDSAPVCTPGPDGRCALCADEGLPGQVIEVRAGNMAWVAMPDGGQEIALDLLEDVQAGDWVLVHLGFAIVALDGGRLNLAASIAAKSGVDER